jgi:hypothetical protein
MDPEFETIRTWRRERVAHIELHRPERLNAIVDPMPTELRAAVEAAPTRSGADPQRRRPAAVPLRDHRARGRAQSSGTKPVQTRSRRATRPSRIRA